ncbi:MAG: hypothetical protein ACFCUX_07820 [Candidatus Methylacidiphilales bacterium]
MPFQASWILDKIRQSHTAGRLGHAYIIHGAQAETHENLALDIAALLLGSKPHTHPDFHQIRPESKSRRLTVEQIRELERVLRLKSHAGGMKVGVVSSADRMCLGQAEAANAFLKTLEEPPEHCTLLLTSDRVEQLLPTIRSRCLSLPVKQEEDGGPGVSDLRWMEHWLNVEGDCPVENAYRRSRILQQWWTEIRASVEKSGSGLETMDEDAAAAQTESEFLFLRDQSLSRLIQSVWDHHLTAADLQNKMITCAALEELRYALQRNMEVNLALERCHLMISNAPSGTLAL